MSKIQIQSEIDTQSLLTGVSEMPVQELESFVRELNALITRKKTKDIAHREKILISKINRTVLEKSKAETYQKLILQSETVGISIEDNNRLLELVTEEENLRNERLKYLIELAQLRNIPVIQLMNNLGIVPS
jgi:hypothetical protein